MSRPRRRVFGRCRGMSEPMSTHPRVEFEPDELAEVLARFDLGAIRAVNPQVKGSRLAPKAVVTSDRGRFLLKRRVRGRDHPLKVAYAHAVQDFLARHGFPLPRLIPAAGGEDTMVVFRDRIYEMFEYVDGVPFGRTPEEALDSGRVLALFHTILERFTSDWEPSRQGYHASDAVRASLNAVPASVSRNDSVAGRESELLATVSLLYEAYESAAERVDEAGFAGWAERVVHSDWHPGNMLFEGGRVKAVIDYDSLHIRPAVMDVANGALQFSIIGGDFDPRLWPPELDALRFRAFLQGYRQTRTPDDPQWRTLPWLMIEALVSEAVRPIAATGSFGHMEGFRFLQMICRKVRWLEHNGQRLLALVAA